VVKIFSRTGNVVPLRKDDGDMQFPILNEVEAYWEALRDGRPLPARSDVDPRGLERALEYAFVAERISPTIARLRVAGNHMNDLMGMDVRGMPLSALFTVGARPELAKLLQTAFDGPTIVRATLSGPRAMGQPALEGGLLMLPLLSDKNEVSRMLGCLVSQGSIGRLPRRFELASAKTRALLGSWPQNPVPVSTPGFAEPLPAFSGAQKRPGTERPALRLVKTDGS